MLDTFIKLGVPVARVLRTSLDWYNDWCHCLYTLQKTDEIRTLMKPACAVADQLAPLCEPGRGFDPGNQVLSTHMLLRGFVAADPAESLDHYTDALKWNDANDNARQLAAGARKQNLHERLGEAVKHIEAKTFDKAYEAIERIGEPDDEEGRNSVRQARSAVCFRHAMALAEEGHFRKALARSREGAALAPGEDAFTNLTRQLEELAPNEDNVRHMRAAKEAMDKDHFDEVIAHASKVDSASSFASQAKILHSAACFRRGIAAAQRENFTDALSDLRQALTLNDNPKEQAVIRQQIHAIKQAEIGSGLKSAFEKRDWMAAESHLRDALLQGDLTRKVKKSLQSQLSGVLNAAAVELANRAQKVTDEDAAQLDAFSDTLLDPQGFPWLTTRYGSKDGLRSFLLSQAVKKLTDAVELDPGNAAAKQNLKAIAELASRHGDFS